MTVSFISRVLFFFTLKRHMFLEIYQCTKRIILIINSEELSLKCEKCKASSNGLNKYNFIFYINNVVRLERKPDAGADIV